MAATASMPISGKASTYDEVSMRQRLLFSDSLKDLRNLRTQLYSAAEYFELSYTNDDHKQTVVETLKDYAIKALINTVDHLGSVTYKVNDLLGEKVDELSVTELGVSCIQQRLQNCREYTDHEGISQQSLSMHTPKYHKRYLLPAGETMNVRNSKLKYLGCSLDDEDDWHQFRDAVRATIKETPTPPSSVRKGNSPLPSPQRLAAFSFTDTTPQKEQENRTVSPLRFPLLRSESFSRPTTPNKSRPTTPNSRRWVKILSFSLFNLLLGVIHFLLSQYPSEPRRSASMRIMPEKASLKEIEQYPSKSKRLLKALLSRRKSKKDEMLYTYLDEY